MIICKCCNKFLYIPAKRRYGNNINNTTKPAVLQNFELQHNWFLPVETKDPKRCILYNKLFPNFDAISYINLSKLGYKLL